MFSKKLKLAMVTFLLIAFCIVSINVLFSQADDDDEIAGFKCDDYLTQTYTDANGAVKINGCGDIPQVDCDDTDLTLTINASAGCNTADATYTCEETTETLDHGTVECGWVDTSSSCDPTSYTEVGKDFKDCKDQYVGGN